MTDQAEAQVPSTTRTDDETLARGARRFVEHPSVSPGYSGIGFISRTQGGFYRAYSNRCSVGIGPFSTAADAEDWVAAKHNEGPQGLRTYKPDLARRNALRWLKGTPGVFRPTADDLAVLLQNKLIELAHPERIGADCFDLTDAGKALVASIGERG